MKKAIFFHPAPRYYRETLFESLAEIVQLEVFFTAIQDSSEYAHERNEIGRLKRSKGGYAFRFGERYITRRFNNFPIEGFVAAFRYEVIIFSSYFSPLFLVLAPLLWLFGKKVILFEEIWIYPRDKKHNFLRKLVTFFLNNFVDVIVATGSQTARHLRKVHKVPNNKIVTISNVLKMKPNTNRVRQCETDRKIRILLCGRLVPYKGIARFLEHYDGTGRVSITIIGDGPDRAKIVEQSKAKKFRDIRVLGGMSHEDLQTEFLKTDLLLMPCVFLKDEAVPCESWGFTLQEALSCGCRVLASRAVGAAYDLLRDSSFGKISDLDNMYLETFIEDSFSKENRAFDFEGYVRFCNLASEKKAASFQLLKRHLND